MTGVEDAAERYIEYKQALGFDFSGEMQRLQAFAASLGGRDVSRDAALAWACSGSGHPRSYQAQRYETVRRLSEFAHALDRSFPMMQPGLLGSTGARVVPYIYTEEDACVLMRAALDLRSPDGLRAESLSFLIGIMWSCGLRVGEALGLKDVDFDADKCLLSIRDSKFGSSRVIPVANDVAKRVSAYQHVRDVAAPMRAHGTTIVSTGGKPLSENSAERMFCEIRWSLLGRGESFPGRMPRLHDLRHTFSVRTILRWYAQGEDVNAMMPYLSAYLGHRKLSDTYWYLTGAPELMEVAAGAFRAAGLGGGAS